MRIKTGLVMTALLLMHVASLTAQKAGAIEIGGFGRYSKFDGALNFDSRVGVGGRLGIFVLPNLEVEGDASYTATASEEDRFIRAIPLHARLVYNLPMGEYSALLIGGGYTRQLFRKGYRETNLIEIRLSCVARRTLWIAMIDPQSLRSLDPQRSSSDS